MVRPFPRLARRSGAAMLAAALLGTTALVGAPSANAGEVTQVHACEWPDTAVRSVTLSVGGEAPAVQVLPGDQFTLDESTLESTLPWWTIEEAAQFEILGNYPVVEGENVIDVDVDLTIQVTNAIPAAQTVTIPTTVTVDYTSGLEYTEEAQQPHVISVDLDVPDTTWTRTGTGAVDFSLKTATVKAEFDTMPQFGFVPIFNDCKAATFNETFDPTYVAPLVFESLAALPAPRFSDVPYDHGFYDDIEWLAESEITGGYVDGTFKPSNPVSRQGFAQFLYKFAGSPAYTAPSTATFPDVPVGSQFATPIEWAHAEGIIDGYGDGTFGPTRDVTRQAASQWIYKYEDPTFTAPTTATFSDVPVSNIFFPAVEWMSSADIADGYPDGSFGPTRVAARQAAAKWFHLTSLLATAQA